MNALSAVSGEILRLRVATENRKDTIFERARDATLRMTTESNILNTRRDSSITAGRTRARTMDFQAGDVGYVQQTLPHYIENTGNTDLKFLEMFRSSFYQDLSLSEWLTHTPPELVMAHLNIDKATLEAIPRDEPVIMPL